MSDPTFASAELQICPHCLLSYSGLYARHRRWECLAVHERDDLRDACQAAGLPRDAALWRLLNVIAKRAREQALAEARTAVDPARRLRASLQSDSLDAAWAAVMAALPNGNEHRGHPLWRFGSWRMKLIGPWDIEHDGYRPTWQAIADPYNEGTSQDPRDRSIECLGPTPVAALRALEAKLRTADR